VQINDAIVVGGGIVGCSIALRLSETGLRTVIIERGTLGCEASRAAAGMLSPQASTRGPSPFLDLCLRSLELYPDWIRKIHELSGIDPEYQEQGTLCVALGPDEQHDIDEWTSWQIAAGLRVEKLSAEEVRAIEPSLSEQVVGGVKLPGDHQVENRRLMDALGVAIRRRGIEVVEGRPVDSLKLSEGRAAGVTCGGELLKSGLVILAAGCWSGSVFQDAGLALPIEPARGQILAVKAESRPFSHVIHSGECYLVPRQDNRIVVGSTVEYTGFHKATTAGGLLALLRAAVEVVPSLGDLEMVESWCGLRPDTPDHLPVLGPSGIDNLYLATGHFRNGILLAPITGEILTKCVAEGSMPAEASAFGAERFSSLPRTEPRDQ